MKKLLFMLFVMAMIFPSMVYADACFNIQRQEDWKSGWTPGYVNNLPEEEQIEFAARTRPFDIVVVYPGEWCPPPDETYVQDPDSEVIVVLVYGIDYADALRYMEEYNDFTGELDENGEAITYTKRDHKFNISSGNLPGPARNLFDNNSFLAFQWEDIRGFVADKLTGSIGE